MKAYILDKLPQMLSTTLFHAMAQLGQECLILCEPEDTYVSLGYFDKTEELIDVDRCRQLGIGLIRRQVGGGAVLLAPGQVFYQLVLPKNKVPFKVEDAYRKLSKPVIHAYERLGLEVEYRPINDLLVKRNQRKISGQGAGDIGKLFVFVGNMLIKFEPDLMSELFKVKSADLRERVRKSLWDNISWLERELRRNFTFEEVAEVLFEEFSKEFDMQVCQEVPEEALELAERLKTEMTSEETLFEDTGRNHDKIKIREGVYIQKG
ncbi:MAG: biotin/lipoate A/B protein ligase family protein [Aquificaceae bacterium]|nr:lipoate--protein ligase family protein [Aquificaceae bacterium]MDW8423084.1 biotin/lipoate A/B protein ligase family protein [Aquificaceae bacterium]